MVLDHLTSLSGEHGHQRITGQVHSKGKASLLKKWLLLWLFSMLGAALLKGTSFAGVLNTFTAQC
jgi:hypothetical protein